MPVTIVSKKVNEIVIKNSRFICIVIPINSALEVKEYLAKIKEQYKGATHYCFAYICDELRKSFDDGEPSGTAGIPIMQVLDNSNLNHILAIVVRYFGGVKLGVGGLLRAYSKSVTETLKLCDTKEIILGYYIKISFNYNYLKQVDYLLKDVNIIKKDYGEQVNYYFYCSNNLLNEIKNFDFILVEILEKNIYL